MPEVLSGGLDGRGLKVGIVVSRWNRSVTDGLLAGAREALDTCGVCEDRVVTAEVPGAFEIPIVADALAQSGCDAIVALGCVIKGETAHFEYVSNRAMQGIATVSDRRGIPVTCGILTTYDEAQAVARSQNDDENKGREAALAAVETANLLRTLRSTHAS
jgi:6,7-dimethyl-8-ribityllumazine synthase